MTTLHEIKALAEEKLSSANDIIASMLKTTERGVANQCIDILNGSSRQVKDLVKQLNRDTEAELVNAQNNLRISLQSRQDICMVLFRSASVENPTAIQKAIGEAYASTVRCMESIIKAVKALEEEADFEVSDELQFSDPSETGELE